jgi:hypothetical protein
VFAQPTEGRYLLGEGKRGRFQLSLVKAVLICLSVCVPTVDWVCSFSNPGMSVVCHPECSMGPFAWLFFIDHQVILCFD